MISYVYISFCLDLDWVYTRTRFSIDFYENIKSIFAQNITAIAQFLWTKEYIIFIQHIIEAIKSIG